jgi:acetate kinase
VIVLCVNSGSSSLKLALYRDDERLASCSIEGVGLDRGRLRLRDASGAVVRDEPGRVADQAHAVHQGLGALEGHGFPAADAAGHRFVHGGPHQHAPRRLDAALIAGLREVVAFAPLHLPAALLGVEAVAARRPGLPQVVCFDTDFHWEMPQVARRLPLPRALDEAGVRKYGFHGLSYESVVADIGAARLGRAVIAHLGNGASMAAVRDGRSVDTTMGLTPAGGFMMGTRTGDLDPGVLLHLIDALGYDSKRLEDLVDRRSGLLAVSERTSDVRDLLERRSTDPRAAFAVEMFCYQARKAAGALAAALGGIDSLVFTGGIGEHAAPVREGICSGLQHLGVRLDPARNATNAAVISADGSACTVRVVAANEERSIAHPLTSAPGAWRRRIPAATRPGSSAPAPPRRAAPARGCARPPFPSRRCRTRSRGRPKSARTATRR